MAKQPRWNDPTEIASSSGETISNEQLVGLTRTSRHRATRSAALGAPTICTAGTNSGQYTFSELYNTDVAANWLYLVYLQSATTTSYIDGAKVAWSASFNDAVSPIDGSGNAQSFIQATFNNAGAFLPPATKVTGSATTLTMPGYSADTDGWRFKLYYSDPIAMPPVLARSDGGPGYLAMVRSVVQSGHSFTGPSLDNNMGAGGGNSAIMATAVTVAAGGSGYPNGTNILAVNINGSWLVFSATAANGAIVAINQVYNWPTDSGGTPSNPIAVSQATSGAPGSGCTVNVTWAPYNHRTFYGRDYFTQISVGDQVTTITTPSCLIPLRSPGTVGILPVSAQRCTTILSFGSSWSAGHNTTSGMCNYIALAANAVSSPANPVHVVNAASSPMTSAQMLERANDLIAAVQPQIVWIESWNGNDPQTQSGITANMQNVMAIADLAERNGAVVVFGGVLPSNTANSTLEALRQQFNTMLDQWVSGGGYAVFVDRNVGYTTAAGTQLALPQYSTDGTHINTAAHQVLATGPVTYGLTAAGIIQRLIGVPVTY